MSNEITSVQNAQVKLWASLKTTAGRKEHRLFLAEGEHMVQEALSSAQTPILLCDAERLPKYRSLLDRVPQHYVLASHVLDKICDTKTNQGIAAVCPFPAPPISSAYGTKTLALNGIQDPGNIGTIMRTMDAAGFDTLFIDDETADPFSPKALRASMGAIFRVRVCRFPSLDSCLKDLNGYEIIAGDLNGEPFFEKEYTGRPFCLLIGNEGRGVSPHLLMYCTHKLKLPMPGKAESLNAAVAASIMMYDFVRLSVTNKE